MSVPGDIYHWLNMSHRVSNFEIGPSMFGCPDDCVSEPVSAVSLRERGGVRGGVEEGLLFAERPGPGAARDDRGWAARPDVVCAHSEACGIGCCQGAAAREGGGGSPSQSRPIGPLAWRASRTTCRLPPSTFHNIR